jgi:hypothetical protein
MYDEQYDDQDIFQNYDDENWTDEDHQPQCPNCGAYISPGNGWVENNRCEKCAGSHLERLVIFDIISRFLSGGF